MNVLGKNGLIRRAHERGYFDHGWLKTYHTFSFGEYYDPHWTGFHSLRVINEDIVDPGRGFAKHPHKDMEIFTYVIEGALEHKDSMGNSSVIRAGEVQKMTAGTGIYHSEHNASDSQIVHLYQIWILPDKNGLPPSYQQFSLKPVDMDNPITLIGSPQGGDGVLQFHQKVEIYRGLLKMGAQSSFLSEKVSSVWVQVISGSLQVAGLNLNAGDGVGMDTQSIPDLKALTDTEFLVFNFRK